MTLASLQTPALVIRLARVRRNVDRTLELIGGRAERWRPHVKTAKIPEVLDLLLARGVRRFKCATSREAQVLLSRATEPVDLLVAMAHRGANMERIVRIGQEFPRHTLSIIVEDPEYAEEIRRFAPNWGLYLDLNPGFDRTGIPRDDHERVLACARAAGPMLRGLHDYEGHVRSPDPAERERTCSRIYHELIEIAEGLVREGHSIRELVTSGTPTFANALEFEPFASYDHQVSPGTVVYWDANSEVFGLDGFGPAATVLTHVVSCPAPDRVTCDAGGKAVDAAGGNPCARVVEWPGLRAGTPSEEHLPLTVETGPIPELGRLLELIPSHVCPTVNLAGQAALVDDQHEVRVVPVAARGHEL